MNDNCQPDIIKEYKCLKCTHRWTPRKYTNTLPIMCPNCKSEKWNEPQKNELPSIGHGKELKKELISQQRYLDAKKTVEAWEAVHGGPGSLKQAIDKMARLLNMAVEEFREKQPWRSMTDEQVEELLQRKE